MEELLLDTIESTLDCNRHKECCQESRYEGHAPKILLPVLGVPMESKLQGLDSLLSMVQMPAGIPVGTLAIGKAGAINAALFAAAILAVKHPQFREALRKYREEQAKKVLAQAD